MTEVFEATQPNAESFMAELPGCIKAAEAEAQRRCGLSDVLFDSMCNDAYIAILEAAPESEKAKVEEMLIEQGYDPDFSPYEPGEGECDLTGIDTDCCPCGNHP